MPTEASDHPAPSGDKSEPTERWVVLRRIRPEPEAIEVTLARDLLRIAYMSMPAAHFAADNRCARARAVLERHGVGYHPSHDDH